MPVTLTGPPSACCWTGIKHTGSPQGRIEPLGGLDTYISEPPAGVASGPHKKVLLSSQTPMDHCSSITSCFRTTSPRGVCRLVGMCVTAFDARGFIVLGPDYFFGIPVQNLPSDRDKVAWSLEARAIAVEAFPKWFEQVKATHGTETTKYIAVGYCFGAPFVLDLTAEGSIVAGAIAHPGFLEGTHFQRLTRPLLLSCAEDDFTFPLEARRRAEDILISNKSTYFFQNFSGVSHGFAVRGDPNVPHARWAKEESAREITEWFFRFAA